MVRVEGETSNSLFEVLADWNAYLEAENIDLDSLQQKPSQTQFRGPRP